MKQKRYKYLFTYIDIIISLCEKCVLLKSNIRYVRSIQRINLNKRSSVFNVVFFKKVL